MDIIASVYGGLIGALSMFVLMELITLSGLANADMVRAVGSMITRKEENSLKVGMSLHLVAGLIFSLFYCYVLSTIPNATLHVFVGAGAFLGFAHGLIVSYIILIEGQNRHPVEKFRNAGFEVALAHVVGHVIYGVSLAYVYGVQTLGLSLVTEASMFGGWDVYQIYMSVVGTLALASLVILSIKNSIHRHH